MGTLRHTDDHGTPPVNDRIAALPLFVAPKNRDAWSTIRGYVYQVEITVERWLRLTPGQELHIECGEDIDTVSRFIEDGALAMIEEPEFFIWGRRLSMGKKADQLSNAELLPGWDVEASEMGEVVVEMISLTE